MPYVTQERREALDQGEAPENVGELTYVLTAAVDGYVASQPQSFQVLSEAVAALESSKLEFYRRVLEPYENAKWRQNGEVYTAAPPAEPPLA